VTIVLGYDESPGAERALATAITVAKQFDEPLVLVFGAEPPGGLGEEFHSHREALEELGRRAAAQAVKRATEEGVATEVAIVGARPAEALLEVAAERDARMIVVGSYGESPLRGALLGSVPYRLLHRSSVPVLVVPQEAA
jgi:nucleotide-binding universal stress UspA family protein